jgi:hypothetical protein
MIAAFARGAWYCNRKVEKFLYCYFYHYSIDSLTPRANNGSEILAVPSVPASVDWFSFLSPVGPAGLLISIVLLSDNFIFKL